MLSVQRDGKEVNVNFYVLSVLLNTEFVFFCC